MTRLGWAVHLSVVLLVGLWLFPTAGLLVSSFRTADQIAASGWWSALRASEQTEALRTDGPETARREGDLHVIEGQLVRNGRLTAWGITARDVAAHAPGETVTLRDGSLLLLRADGSYRLESATAPTRGQRVFVSTVVPPQFTLANYDKVLGAGVAARGAVFALAGLVLGLVAGWSAGRIGLPPRPAGWAAGLALTGLLVLGFGLGTGAETGAQTTDSMARAFLNTLTVTIPATIIPICIAAFAAYALAWMDFPGRALLIALVVALLVVPLHLALIPLLRLHLSLGIGKGYVGVWLAHTGFGLPLAIYLLRNYMAGLPRDIIENARVDGASEFQIFTRIVLPLSFPALASFAIFQFLWTWNDLLVAKVFLIDATGETTVMTNQIIELMGTRGGNWEILATAAFVSILVPLGVFFAMQRYLVRGLLAGSVK